MFRAVLVILTTIALLACPHYCAARMAVSSPAAKTKQGCSCCCKKCASKSNRACTTAESSPQAPVDGDDFCSCVCNGAISAVSTSIGHAALNWLDCRVLVAQLNNLSFVRSAYSGPPADETDDGLGPRLSMQSLLL